MSAELDACVAYFRARPVYDRLFRGLREKYAGLGHLGGTVTLTGLGTEDKRQLGGFLRRDYTENRTVSVSYQRLEAALRDSRFAALRWEDILERYFGEPLTAKRDERRRAAETMRRYFAESIDRCAYPAWKSWLADTLHNRGAGYPLLTKQYRENPEGLRTALERAETGAALLENCRAGRRKERLPVFAAKVTGDPHAFDEGQLAERLLSLFLEAHLRIERRDGLSHAEYKSRLCYEAGLLRDALSNDVLVYGVRGWRADGTPHAGLEGFCQSREPMKLTLHTLGGLERVRSVCRTVDIVENPAVFAALTERFPARAFVCGNGQPKLAVYVLLDKLAEESTFRYAGDHDPEGLLIAQKLKERYGDALRLWGYRTDWYERYQSDVVLEETRLSKLDNLRLEELQALRQAMLRDRRAAYQEAMLAELLRTSDDP